MPNANRSERASHLCINCSPRFSVSLLLQFYHEDHIVPATNLLIVTHYIKISASLDEQNKKNVLPKRYSHPKCCKNLISLL